MARNFSCGSAPVTLAECSGNGACVYSPVFDRGVCACYEGFRGNSDFRASSSLVDCHINNTAIIVLWSIVLAIGTGFTLLITHRIHGVIQAQRETNIGLAAAGKPSVSIFSNKAFVAVLPYVIFGLPSLLITACLRIAAQESNIIGEHWLITVLWFILRASFYFSARRFQPALIESLLKGQRACEEVLRRNRAVANLILFLSVSSMFTILAPLLSTPADPFDFFWGQFSYVMCSGTLVLAMVVSVFQTRFATRKINEVLVASYENTGDARTLTIANNLKELQTTLIRQQTIQFVIQLFITCAPFMWTKHDYIYVVTSTLTAFVVYSAVNSISKIQRRSPRGSKTTTTSKATQPDNALTPAFRDESTGDLS